MLRSKCKPIEWLVPGTLDQSELFLEGRKSHPLQQVDPVAANGPPGFVRRCVWIHDVAPSRRKPVEPMPFGCTDRLLQIPLHIHCAYMNQDVRAPELGEWFDDGQRQIAQIIWVEEHEMQAIWVEGACDLTRSIRRWTYVLVYPGSDTLISQSDCGCVDETRVYIGDMQIAERIA